MAAIQAMKGDSFRSFDVLALQYMRNLLSCFSQANTVVEVFDRYDNEHSVKTAERMRRHGNGARQYQVISGRSVPAWKKFLAHPANKAALAVFLSSSGSRGRVSARKKFMGGTIRKHKFAKKKRGFVF